MSQWSMIFGLHSRAYSQFLIPFFMYAKIINPKTNDKKVYDNKGSLARLGNYLAHEAKAAGEAATFFGAPGTGEKTLAEVVALIDGNVKGLGKDAAKFYSLVLSPSPEELTHIGNDAQGLAKYTQHVMELYAKNFHLKNGRELGEPNLVWAATIHDERKNRGTDEGVQGEKKDGLQTHIHIVVSARDADQKITLNPLGTPDRFNRVQFQANALAQFDIQFGVVSSTDLSKPAPTCKQLVAEKANEQTRLPRKPRPISGRKNRYRRCSLRPRVRGSLRKLPASIPPQPTRPRA
jgi:hypothetical protein